MKRATLLFSVDGMRPDALVQAYTPALDRMIREGAATMKARTILPSVTLPCHTSMFRGVDSTRHGITTNIFTPLARPVPSFVDVAAQHGKKCGMFYNWGPLRDLCGPEALHFSYLQGVSTDASDRRVAKTAAEHIVGDGLDFAFIYLGFTDTCGHDHGWMSEPYLKAIEEASQRVGEVLVACEQAGIAVTAVVQSDHGGHDRSHGTEMPEDMTIPWILWGDGVAPRTIDEEVRIFDTCPTMASLLSVPKDQAWEGLSRV